MVRNSSKGVGMASMAYRSSSKGRWSASIVFCPPSKDH
jgi:hypothetical protein